MVDDGGGDADDDDGGANGYDDYDGDDDVVSIVDWCRADAVRHQRYLYWLNPCHLHPKESSISDGDDDEMLEHHLKSVYH